MEAPLESGAGNALRLADDETPGVTLHDLTHEIAPQDVAAAAFTLAAACDTFPDGTIHLAALIVALYFHPAPTVVIEEPERNIHPHVMRRTLLLFAETVLRPVIRMLLRFGVSYPEFNQISRKLYVDVAMQEPEFRIPRRRRQYKSRVALLTALSRKEVLRLLEFKGPEELEGIQPLNRAARVLTGWTSNDLFCTGKDRPKVLAIKGGTGSFHDLVRLYSGDPSAGGQAIGELVKVGCGRGRTVEPPVGSVPCHASRIQTSTRSTIPT